RDLRAPGAGDAGGAGRGALRGGQPRSTDLRSERQLPRLGAVRGGDARGDRARAGRGGGQAVAAAAARSPGAGGAAGRRVPVRGRLAGGGRSGGARGGDAGGAGAERSDRPRAARGGGDPPGLRARERRGAAGRGRGGGDARGSAAGAAGEGSRVVSEQIGRIAAFYGPGKPFRINEYRVPEPGPGAVVLRTTLANVCGSDLHQWRGEFDVARFGRPYPQVLGHEMTGRVVALGEGVTRDTAGAPLAVGDRVVFRYTSPCRRCRACLK